MIYIFANSGPEATKFAVKARLNREPVKIITAGTEMGELHSFQEDDEVYAIAPCVDQKQKLNSMYGKSWPRPHIFKFLEA